jgi:hypothetical protein
MSISSRTFLICSTFAVLGLQQAGAVEVAGLSIHGSVSDTESWSDKYNFYGDTADQFDNNVKELTLNAGYRWGSGLRFSAQLYASDVDHLSTVALDFATLDYSFGPGFGIRLGRNKTSFGLYGDAQDLDQVRTFANLPLGFYPRTERSLTNIDGLNLYGTISAGTAGSLDYTVFAGKIENIPSDALIARMSGGLIVDDGIEVAAASGANLFWNLPVDGLRIGATGGYIPNIRESGHLAGEAFALQPGLTFNPTPLGIDQAFGPGAWNHAFAGTAANTQLWITEQIFSAEYTRGKWVFAAEWKQILTHGTTTIPALGVKNSYSNLREIESYAMATYQATKQVGLGVYEGFTDNDTVNHQAMPKNLRTQTDAAAVVAYAPVPWWLFKVEFHEMNGLALVNQAGDFNPNAPQAGNRWEYLVFRSTISF